MFNILTLWIENHGLDPWLSNTKDYKIEICCFSAIKQAGKNLVSSSSCLI